MAFKNVLGQVVSQNDINEIKRMYEEIFNAYHNSLAELQENMPNSPFYPPIFAKMEQAKADFFNAVNNAFVSNKTINLNKFLDAELEKYSDSVAKAANKNNALEYPDFEKNFIEDFEGKKNKTALKDTYEGLEQSMGSFSLTKTAFPGIDNIDDYNPNVNNEDALSEVRKANSSTLDVAENDDSPENQAVEVGYRTSLKIANSQASLLMGKKQVTFADLYETFTTINRMVRAGDPEGGKLRGEMVYFGDNKSIAPVAIPGHMYSTFSKIADSINKIKQTQDPLVKKSQAIQLAAFTYQMMVSEHVFKDGNGRSCRMFADTILQTFGLPSHTPNYSLMSTGGTIGKKLDFDKGARLFYEGVKTSNDLLRLGKTERAEGIENQATRLLANTNITDGNVILKHVSPKKAISMAVTAKENVFGFMETLDDFIKADHLFSKNSDQYKKLTAKAKEVRDVLKTNDPGSFAVNKKFKELRESIAGYKAHCERHPKDNKTRKARLDAVHNFEKSMYHIETQAKQIGKIRAQEIMNTQFHDIQDRVINDYQNNHKATDIAKFILTDRAEKGLTRYIEGNLPENGQYESIEELKMCAMLDQRVVDFVTKSPALREAIQVSFQKPEYHSMTVKEQLSTISKSFEEISKRQALENKNKSANKDLANQKVGKGKTEPAPAPDDHLLMLF